MGKVRSLLESSAIVFFGGLIYTVLNWVPILGSAVVGLLVGYKAGGGFRRGFNHGVYAASFGAVLLAYLIASQGILETSGQSLVLTVFIGWVLLVWNAFGVLLAGVFAGAAAVGKGFYSLIPLELFGGFSDATPPNGVRYVICPSCGQGNLERAKTCVSCGSDLT